MSDFRCPIQYISTDYEDNQTKIMETPKKYLNAGQLHQLEEKNKNNNSKKAQNYQSNLMVNPNITNDIKNPNNMDDRNENSMNMNEMILKNSNNSMKNNNMNNNIPNSYNNQHNNMNNNNFNNMINNNCFINKMVSNNNNFPANNMPNNIDINNFNNLNNVPITGISMFNNMNFNSNSNMCNNNMDNMNVSSMNNNIINSNNSMNNYNNDIINVTFRVTCSKFPPISFNCSINLPLKNIIWEYLNREHNFKNPKNFKIDGNEITNSDLTLKQLGKSGGQNITIFVIYNN